MALVNDKMFDAISKVFGPKVRETKDNVQDAPSLDAKDFKSEEAILDGVDRGSDNDSVKNPSIREAKRGTAKVLNPTDADGRPVVKPAFRSPFSSAAKKEDMKKLLFSTDINDVMAAIDAGYGPDTEISSKDLPENNLKNVPEFTMLDLGKLDALTYWCWKGLISHIQFVLDRCDYKVKSSYPGMTPATAAVRKQDYSVLRLILRYFGKDTDIANIAEGNTGMTPLALACYSIGAVIDPTDCVKLLLRNGADVNKAVGEGKVTPLMFAVLRKMRWCPRMVSYLIEHGADIDVKNVNGETAIDIAHELKLRDVSDMLVAAKTKNFQTVKFGHLIDRPNFPVHVDKE